MAEDKPDIPKKRGIKKIVTVRERAAKAQGAQPRGRRLKAAGGKIRRPISKARSIGRKEYYLPMPDNKVGRFLNKRRRIIPKYFRDAWAEIKLVTWPTRRETVRLSLSVFVFAIGFSIIVGIVDFGLDKVFKEVFVNS